MKKSIKIILSILVIALGVSVFFIVKNDTPEKKAECEIKATIKQFYDLSYDGSMKWEMQDFSSVLDEKSKFGANYLAYYEGYIIGNKYALEKGYSDYKVKKLPMKISFEEISVKDDVATVKVNIAGDKKEAYPFFVCWENIFTLENIEGEWLVTSIETNDTIFIMLNDVEFERKSVESIQETVDKNYGIKK
ncbi:MAG: hypothetical protein GX241_00580 [Ruminococcaceae bacterium]|nr:hypothetical protein [Oscillospiraceae bacterium]